MITRISILQSGHRLEIVKPTDTSNTSDTDSDGVTDDTDYFPDNPNYTNNRN